MAFVVTVGEVESCNGQTAVDQSFQLFDFPASRTQSTDDLGLTGGCVGLGQDLVQSDVSSAEFRTSRGQLRVHVFQNRSHGECIEERMECFSMRQRQNNDCRMYNDQIWKMTCTVAVLMVGSVAKKAPEVVSEPPAIDGWADLNYQSKSLSSSLKDHSCLIFDKTDQDS